MNLKDVNLIISNILGVEDNEIFPEAHFLLDLNATPKELIEIKNAIEQHLDISLPIEASDDFPETIEEFYQIVQDSCL